MFEIILFPGASLVWLPSVLTQNDGVSNGCASCYKSSLKYPVVNKLEKEVLSLSKNDNIMIMLTISLRQGNDPEAVSLDFGKLDRTT